MDHQLIRSNTGCINAIHGHIYQSKVLMLFLYRGISRKYSFRLGTEVKEAGKFDDLVFEYVQDDEKIYRLLQAKHKVDESRKITVDNLLCELNGDYSLINYFQSYQACKRDDFFKNSLIKDVTICTNIDFDFESLKEAGIEVKEMTEKDDILDVKSDKKQPMKYMFSKGLISKLNKKLHECQIDSSIEDVKDFFRHLVFAVNQPNEKELGDIVKNEIGKELDPNTTEILYNKISLRMLNLIKDGINFISYEEGEELFEELLKSRFVRYNVQNPVKSFTGRVEQLKNIHSLLQDKTSNIICISGLGGVGKSELVRKYIAQYSKIYDNQIVWINAETCQSLKNCFHELAKDHLRISTKNIDGEEINTATLVAKVYKYFSKGNSLFVFDNAEVYISRRQLDSGIYQFLPNLEEEYKKPHIIVTSRNRKWPEHINTILLEVFDEQEAIEFISKSLKLENSKDTEQVVVLGRKLQFLPLALQQAVAYISDSCKDVDKSVGICDYLKLFDEKSEKVLNFEFPSHFENTYDQTVFTTWNISFEAIKRKDNGENALKILNIMSYLLPDNITSELLSVIVHNENVIAAATDLLQEFSLIAKHGEILNVHRLVQQITRMKLEETNNEEETLEEILKAIDTANVNIKNIDHFISIWKHSIKYVKLVEKYYSIPEVMMKKLISSARNEEAHRIGMEMLTLLSQSPADSIDVQKGILNTKICIANIFLRQGDYDKALHELETISQMEIMLKVEFAPEYIDIHCDIARALEKLGRYDEALELYKKVLPKKSDNSSGGNDVYTRAVKHEIASILYQKGQYNEALIIFQQVYDEDIITLGKDHELTLATRSNIAMIFVDLSRVEESLKMFQDIYEIRQKQLPKNHPDLIVTRQNIAGVLNRQEKYASALEIYEDIFKSSTELYGDNHPNVMILQSLIACTLLKLGNTTKALKILKELAQKQTDILGSEHPDTLTTQFAILKDSIEQGKADPGDLGKYQKFLQTCLAILGNDHHVTNEAREFVAQLFAMQDKYEESLFQLWEVYKVRERTLGKNNIGTLNTRRTIGMYYYLMKDYKTAFKMMNEQREIDEMVLGKNHPYYNETCYVLNQIASDMMLHGSNRVQNSTSSPSNPFIAVQTNNISLLKQLVKDGLDINKPDESSRTLLHHAASVNSLEIVKYLLKNQADITRVTDKGNTALHLAVSKDHYDIADELLKNITYDKLKGFVDAKTIMTGTTALHIASKGGFYYMIELLLFRGACFDMRNKEKKTPLQISKSKDVVDLLKNLEILFEFAESGSTECHNRLKNCTLSEYWALTSARNSSGCNLMQVAVKNNHRELVCLLVDLINLRSTDVIPSPSYELHLNDLLPLAESTVNCTKDMFLKNVKKLIATFRDVNKQALDLNILVIEDMLWLLDGYCSSSVSMIEFVKQVIETHVNMMLVSIYTMKLFKAAKSNDVSAVKICIAKKVNINMKDAGGWTPLHYATNATNAEIVKILIDNRASVNCTTNLGKNTPLHIAVNKSHLEIVELLLAQDSSSEFINAQTEAKGSTAVHIAAKLGRMDVILLLLTKGAIYCLRNKDGKLPMDVTSDESIKKFFKIIDELFFDAKTGRLEFVEKLNALTREEYSAASNVRDENGFELLSWQIKRLYK